MCSTTINRYRIGLQPMGPISTTEPVGPAQVGHPTSSNTPHDRLREDRHISQHMRHDAGQEPSPTAPYCPTPRSRLFDGTGQSGTAVGGWGGLRTRSATCTQNYDVAMFHDLGSSPATPEAARVADWHLMLGGNPRAAQVRWTQDRSRPHAMAPGRSRCRPRRSSQPNAALSPATEWYRRRGGGGFAYTVPPAPTRRPGAGNGVAPFCSGNSPALGCRAGRRGQFRQGGPGTAGGYTPQRRAGADADNTAPDCPMPRSSHLDGTGPCGPADGGGAFAHATPLSPARRPDGRHSAALPLCTNDSPAASDRCRTGNRGQFKPNGPWTARRRALQGRSRRRLHSSPLPDARLRRQPQQRRGGNDQRPHTSTVARQVARLRLAHDGRSKRAALRRGRPP